MSRFWGCSYIMRWRKLSLTRTTSWGLQREAGRQSCSSCSHSWPPVGSSSLCVTPFIVPSKLALISESSVWSRPRFRERAVSSLGNQGTEPRGYWVMTAVNSPPRGRQTSRDKSWNWEVWEFLHKECPLMIN